MTRTWILAALLPAAQAFACAPALRGDGVRRIDGERHVLAWQAPAPIPLAQFFSLELSVCARAGAEPGPPRIEATMPEHGHGMNYRPSITRLGDGHFRASGLLLHMPGHWTLSFTVDGETLRHSLLLE